jgi:hypothetical protein
MTESIKPVLRNRGGVDVFDILLFLALVCVGTSPLFMR